MTDWAADVHNYVKDADEEAIAGVIRHCGIALRKADSSLVSFSDPAERKRVRDSFMKKKLGRTESDEELDAVLDKIGEVMKGTRRKNRVTVYYLIAEHYGQLALFYKKKK
ncbi:MAG: hypothetical protein CR979_01525 [Propionibacterium sp.]|nr:MAG: hypothetical protein CR979_01525 [Propionibacterium sp.]